MAGQHWGERPIGWQPEEHCSLLKKAGLLILSMLALALQLWPAVELVSRWVRG